MYHRLIVVFFLFVSSFGPGCIGEFDSTDDDSGAATHGSDLGMGDGGADSGTSPTDGGMAETDGSSTADSDGGQRMPDADSDLDGGMSTTDGDTATDAADMRRDAGQPVDPPNILFSSGFSGVRVCDEDGECEESPLASSYYECNDNAVHLQGMDTETGYTWPTRGMSDGDMPGNASRNYFNDVIKPRSPDCCSSGCSATALNECHDLTIIDGMQRDGTMGKILKLQPLKDCSNASYSRLQYGMSDADPPTGNGWEDMSEFYYEMWVRFPNLDSVFNQSGVHAGLGELYNSSSWKLAIVMSYRNGKPVLQLKNGSNSTAYRDNDCSPEENVWFKLRVWYKAGQADGVWRATFTCPDCSTPVPETVVKDFRGRTQENNEDPNVVAPLKNALAWPLEMQIDDFKFGKFVAP